MIRTRQELIDARKKYAAVLDAEKKKIDRKSVV